MLFSTVFYHREVPQTLRQLWLSIKFFKETLFAMTAFFSFSPSPTFKSFSVCTLYKNSLSPLPFPFAFEFWQPSSSDLLTLIPFCSQTWTSLVHVISSILITLTSEKVPSLPSYVFLKSATEEIINNASYSTKVQSLWKCKLPTWLCSSYKLEMSLECFTHSN